MKVLNLYSGIGGNRKLWPKDWQITAVEYDSKIALIYQDLYPQDEVIVDDAHEYLRTQYSRFDFIWTSPPCQTHSSFRFNIGVRYRGVEAQYPDMRLYQEILFLQHHASNKWLVENVKPYYKPLIEPTVQLDRHLFWANFEIPTHQFNRVLIRNAQIRDLQASYGFDLQKYKLPNKRQVLRNCVNPELGQHVAQSVLIT